MGERKVVNKYYPADFDGRKLPRLRRPNNGQKKVRMMLPTGIRCNTCGNYIGPGTKFNSHNEDVIGETYLGIRLFRFYFKCTNCSAELTIKTDPQNSDYVVESGATRNYQAKENRKRDAEDAMESLEKRRLDCKREMDVLAALEEVKSMKSRQATVSFDAMLEALQGTSAVMLEENDEALVKAAFEGRPKEFVRRIPDDEDFGMLSYKKRKVSHEDSLTKANISGSSRILNGVKISVIKSKKEGNTQGCCSGLLSLCHSYDSADEHHSNYEIGMGR